jgi:extradiol dioxygenase family protein
METKGEHIFHLAIPSHDLEAAEGFYVDGIGCEIGRKKDDRITLDFFGDQVVCHKCSEEEIDDSPKMYPRHFGVTFVNEDDFNEVINRAENNGLTFFEEPFRRFEGKYDEHRTFFLQDPSNNLLEFKWYRDPEQMY